MVGFGFLGCTFSVFFLQYTQGNVVVVAWFVGKYLVSAAPETSGCTVYGVNFSTVEVV